MKKIIVVGGMSKNGGISHYIVNTYDKLINFDEFDFNFVSETGSHDFDSFFQKKKVKFNLICPFWRNPLKYIFEWKNYLKENSSAEAIHFHYDKLYFKWIPVMLAKHYGLNRIIVQSHNSQFEGNSILKLLNAIGKKIVANCATDFLAVSEKAGKFMFSTDFKIIPSGINTSKYMFSEKNRDEIRQLNNWTNKVVIGNVGRMTKQKNQLFLLRAFAKTRLTTKINLHLVIVGEGNLRNELLSVVNELDLNKNVTFLPYTKNIEKLYSAFDLFCFPSIYEGLGLALVEAETNGLECIVSDEIPLEAVINDQCQLVKIEENLWITTIRESVENYKFDSNMRMGKYLIAKEKFDNLQLIAKLADIYESLN